MAQLLHALETNFEDCDEICVLLRRGPKFGNNNLYVDSIVNDVVTFMSDEVAKTEGYLGVKSIVAAAAVTANVGLGMCLGATPDGRRAGELISDGGISPVCGANSSGMTATLLSVAGWIIVNCVMVRC